MSSTVTIAIHEAAPVRICSCCKRPIPHHEKATSFKCPRCGVVTLWRCQKCRTMSVAYKCPNCGFEGP
uniref:RNA-binding protein n=1 Tax=Ignisphaera aggregans TaxID=334771 RepID=A0A7C2ZVQ5_9CREN